MSGAPIAVSLCRGKSIAVYRIQAMTDHPPFLALTLRTGRKPCWHDVYNVLGAGFVSKGSGSPHLLPAFPGRRRTPAL